MTLRPHPDYQPPLVITLAAIVLLLSGAALLVVGPILMAAGVK
jgi:hypothetical protein